MLYLFGWILLNLTGTSLEALDSPKFRTREQAWEKLRSNPFARFMLALKKDPSVDFLERSRDILSRDRLGNPNAPAKWILQVLIVSKDNPPSHFDFSKRQQEVIEDTSCYELLFFINWMEQNRILTYPEEPWFFDISFLSNSDNTICNVKRHLWFCFSQRVNQMNLSK